MNSRKKVEAAEAVDHGEPIHIKHRPKAFADVIGQNAIVKSLQAAMKSKARPHAYLFTGPAGTGKTTLARIVAEHHLASLS